MVSQFRRNSLFEKKKTRNPSKFLPPTNFAVFGGHYIFRYCPQGTEIIKIAQVTFLVTLKEFIVMNLSAFFLILTLPA